MATKRNEGYLILAPEAVDTRTVVQSYADLSTIPLPYNGLNVYVENNDKFYYLSGNTWKPLVTLGTDYDDSWIQPALDGKVSRSGDTMTGSLDVLGTAVVYAGNFILRSSASSNQGSGGNGSGGWYLWTDGNFRSQVDAEQIVNFIGGDNISLDYNSTNNTVTINGQAGGSGFDTESDYTINGSWIFTKSLKANNFVLNSSESTIQGAGYAGWTVSVDGSDNVIASNDTIKFQAGSNVSIDWVNGDTIVINSLGGGGGGVDPSLLDSKYDKAGGLVSGTVEVTQDVLVQGVSKSTNFILNSSASSAVSGQSLYTINSVNTQLEHDKDSILMFSGTGAAQMNVALDSVYSVPVGTVVTLINNRTSTLTISKDAGVTINSAGPYTLETDESKRLVKIGTNKWYLIN